MRSVQDNAKQPKIEREKMPYRQGAIGIVVDNQGQFLVVTHSAAANQNAWWFPGGGIEQGETPEETILRELGEEFSTNQFEIVKKSLVINQTDWSNETILAAYQTTGKWWRGQRQHQFLVKFTGAKEDIRPDPLEISEMKWATIDELPDLFVFPNQWERARLVLDELLGAGGQVSR